MLRICLFYFGFLITATGCVTYTPGYIPEVEELGEEVYGAYIKITTISGSKYSGELLAIDEDSIIILSTSRKSDRQWIVVKNQSEVHDYTIRYAQPKNYDALIPVSMLFSLSHGYLLIFTMPINLIVTGAVASGGANSFQYDKRDISLKEARLFARFPQGLPDDFDLKSFESR